jgi:hypothetical protein
MAVPLEGHVTAAEAAFTLRVSASMLGYMAKHGYGPVLGAVRAGTVLSAAGADGAA